MIAEVDRVVRELSMDHLTGVGCKQLLVVVARGKDKKRTEFGLARSYLTHNRCRKQRTCLYVYLLQNENQQLRYRNIL